MREQFVAPIILIYRKKPYRLSNLGDCKGYVLPVNFAVRFNNFAFVKVFVTFFSLLLRRYKPASAFTIKKRPVRGLFLLWCPEVDELLNSVRDKTIDINGWK